MTPPQLTGDTPVLDVLHPIIIDLIHALRNEADVAVLNGIDGRLCEGLHFDKPLRGNARLHNGAAAIAGADVVLDRLNFNEEACFVEILDNLLSGLERRHTGVFATIFVDDTAIVHDVDDGQIMAQANLEVVRVMCRGDLHNAGTEVLLHVAIGNDRDFFIDERQNDRFADECLVALVIRVHRHGGIAQHGFRAGGRKLNVAGAVAQRVTQMPEGTFLFLEHDLGVGNGGLTVRAPVDDALTAVDEPLIVQLLENVVDGLVAALVHREAQAIPVTGGAELFELLDNPAAVLILPRPGALQELFATDFFLCDALFAHGLYDLRLRCDGSVVGARQPQSRIALHSAPTNERILQRFIHGMAKVQLTRDVRGRNDDGVRLLFGIYLGMKVFALHPEVIDPVFNFFRLVSLSKLFRHVFSLQFIKTQACL